MRLTVDPCPFDSSERLQEALGLSRVAADVLVRRGLDDVEAARAFLEIRGSQHDPLTLGDMAAACERIEQAIAAGERIVVHGDYDVDGVCAVAVACAVIEALGGTVEPFLPSRFEEGYGLAVETVERLAADGVGLLVTVDCGITAVDAAARAAALGLALVITDHHRPAEELPACPIVAPHGRGDYPTDLCGTGVAWKLGEALVARAGADEAIIERELDLVALATVADLVPLVDENRALVRSGLEALRRTARPGLDALMRVAKVDRLAIGSTEIGFRLAPRINAAGRLGHPREALELLTTTDERRARELAELLDQRNRERQVVEQEILRDALDLAAALPPALANARGVVLASTQWHVGVIGIVASRVVEKLKKPAVLIAIDGDEGRGSGRSIPSFDLHGALGACSAHLVAWGGHRAAAGVTIRADEVAAFQAAFAAHADAVLHDDDLVPVERMDAVVSLADVSLDLADDLRRLEPHGLGNPAVRLLVPAVELTGISTLGQDGKHLRFTARSASGTCRTVMWGAGAEVSRLAEGGRFDLNCRVERNDWNGTSTVQLTARSVTPVRDVPEPALGVCVGPCDATCGERLLPGDEPTERPAAAGGRRVHDVRGRGAYGEVARLAATGEGILLVCSDVSRRRAMLRGALHPHRFGLDGAVLLSERCVPEAIAARLLATRRGAFIGLTDYPTLPAVAGGFRHVVVLDPPVTAAEESALDALTGDLHLVWGDTEIAVAARGHAARSPREACATVWRALADGPLDLRELGEATGATAHPPFAADLEFGVEVLLEAGLVVEDDEGLLRRADPAPRFVLDTVPLYAARQREHTRLSGVVPVTPPAPVAAAASR